MTPPSGNAPTLTQEDRERIDNEALRLLCAAQRNTIAQLRRSCDSLRVEVDTLLMAMGSEARYGQSKLDWLKGNGTR